ncbi:MAG: hypothetical protein WCG78_08335, partial [Candidatus Omnitrophota bacterium]
TKRSRSLMDRERVRAAAEDIVKKDQGKTTAATVDTKKEAAPVTAGKPASPAAAAPAPATSAATPAAVPAQKQ